MIDNDLKQIIKQAVTEAINESGESLISNFNSIVNKSSSDNSNRTSLRYVKLNSNDKLTLTLEEACKFSGIGKNKIWELVYTDNTDFPYFRVGTKVLINRDMLINWLAKISNENRRL
jgi:excisionase family DNA binding protein